MFSLSKPLWCMQTVRFALLGFLRTAIQPPLRSMGLVTTCTGFLALEGIKDRGMLQERLTLYDSLNGSSTVAAFRQLARKTAYGATAADRCTGC